MRRAFVAGMAALALAGFVGAAEQVTIVRDGKSDYALVVSPGASPAERLAAEEIRAYVKEMSGAELPLATNGQGKAIVVGGRTAAATKPEGYEIRVGDGQVSVMGNSPRATLYGAYRLLEEMGCRFLAPELGHYRGSAEVVPRKETVTLPGDLQIKTAPAMKFRKLYVEEGHSHDAENLRQMVEWMPKAGYNTLVVPTDYQGSGRVKWDNWREALTPELQRRGITIEVGGHGYQNFLNAQMEEGKLFEQHPEWFGQDAKGKRQRAKGWVPCTSNPEAVRYLTDNFLAYIRERPEIQIFDFWPPDGAKWCECEKCKTLGTPADRQAILLAQVKEAVKPVRPDLRLEVIAYSSYVDPPGNQTVDPSVLVDFCPISQQFDHQIDDTAAQTNAKYAGSLRAWRKAFDGDLSIYSYYRKYAWDSLPVLIPHYMQRDLQWYMTLPVQGVSTYAEPGDWFTYELNHYVLARLAWDPNADVDAVIREFARARYGGAADIAVTAYEDLEDVVRVCCSVPHTARKPVEEVAKAEARLAKSLEAVKKASGEATDPAVRHNLVRLIRVFDYAIRDLRVLQLMAKKGPAAREEAVKLHAMVQEHAGEGMFLVVRNRLNQARMLKRFGFDVASAPSGPE